MWFQTGENLHISATYFLKKCTSRQLNRSALTASQVTAGLHCLFAVSPQDDHVKPVGCMGLLSQLPQAEKGRAGLSQSYKQGWAAACGSKTGELWAAYLGCTYSQNPGTWLLWSNFVFSPLPRTLNRVSSCLNFPYSAEKFGVAVIYQIIELQLTNRNL